MSLYDRMVTESKKPKDQADIDKIAAYFKLMLGKGMQFFSPGVSVKNAFSRFPHKMSAGRRASLLKKHAAEIGEKAGMENLRFEKAYYYATGAGAFGHLGTSRTGRGRKIPSSLTWKW